MRGRGELGEGVGMEELREERWGHGKKELVQGISFLWLLLRTVCMHAGGKVDAR